jgi:DNA-binding MarR family transcriptional regulator
MRRKNELIDTVFDIGRQCLLQRRGISMAADISQVDFAVINVLQIGSRISCKDLSKTMKLSTSRCSRIVERLQRKGYVVRNTNPRDRRAVEVSLTTKGMRLKKNIEKLKGQCEKKIFGSIGQKDIGVVKEGMRILRNSLEMRWK